MQTDQQQISEVVRIAIAAVRPGDIVVATFDPCRYAMEEVRAILAPIIESLGAKLAALPEGVELSVVRPTPHAHLSTGPEAAARWQAPAGTAGEAHGDDEAKS